MLASLAAPVQRVSADEPAAELRDFAIRTWTKADGLPDTSVSAILQTRDGYLWIGTDNGLARFDGLKFTKVSLSRPGAKSGISVTALCEDNSGAVWIGSEKEGLFVWRNGSVIHFGVGEGLRDLSVTSLTVDEQGHVWIGTRRGINRWDGNALSAMTTRDGLPDNSILSVHAAHSGTVWITTAAGMCRFVDGKLSRFHFASTEQDRDQELIEAYEDQHGTLWAFCATYIINLAEDKRINYPPRERSTLTRIWSLCEGRDGRLWIGASGRGVFCFDGTKFLPVTLNEGRWPNDVRTICEDHEGNLWLGISAIGLVQLRPQTFSLLTENPGLPPGAATCLITNSRGQLYVGMDSGGVYANVGYRFEEMRDETRRLANDLASTLSSTADGTLWVGTLGSGLYECKNGRVAVYGSADGLSDDSITASCADESGDVWVAARGGGLNRISGGRLFTATRLAGTAITALLAAPGGGVWAGTASGQLIRCDAQFKNLSTNALPSKLGNKPILALASSARHGLWIGTDGGGFGYININTQNSRAWNSQDGLSDDVVAGMQEDSEGNLWLVTPKGLVRVPASSLESVPLKAKLLLETDPGPLRGLKTGGPRAVRAADGRLWFALSSGLVGVEVHGSELEAPPPPVHVEAMLVNHRQIDTAGTGPIIMPAALRSLEFQYTALSFQAPEKLRFRHKLTGFDPDWVESGSNRSVQYGPLPSGNYTFHITACNAQGLWNDTGASLGFVVPTPLWRAPWVLALCALLATSAGATTVRFVSHRRLRQSLTRLEQQQAMERERMRIAQNMHDEIGSKLTKISFLSERAKVELHGVGKVAGKIDSIASTSRELLKALDEIVWAVNPRNDTLEHLAAYLCQYAREYFQDTSVECDVSIQNELPHVEMSAEIRHNLFLAFEESLNNILKHSGASRIRIEISTKQDKLMITVQDNGRGFQQASKNGAHEGNGLGNMRQRLDDAGGECSILSSNGIGTTVNLGISLSSAKIRIS
jgi:ligand-binding sensor domain-containing protein/signal transduction histidine kinase